MRDTLDLNQLTKDIRSQKSRNRFLAVLLIAVVIGLALAIWLSGNKPPQIYVNTSDGWRGLSGSKGEPFRIYTSPDGVTWLLTSVSPTLNRWTGDNWQAYRNATLETVDCICGMAIENENVWIATDKGMFEFDGQTWTTYPDAVKSKPISIAASDFGVYVIDGKGNLSHFDGLNWSITNVREILPNLKSNEDDVYPSLFAASDGSIVMQWNGVWAFWGDGWREVTIQDTHLNRVELLGTAHNRMWTAWGDGVVVSTLDGQYWKSYDLSEMHLSPNGIIHQVGENGDHYLFATNEGLVDFDSDTETWQKVQLPNAEMTDISAFGTNDNGTIWIVPVVDMTGSVISRFISAILPLILLIIVLITLALYIQPILRRLKNARLLISEALPDLPPYATNQNPQWLMMLLGVGYGLLLVIGFLGLVNLLPIPIVIIILFYVFTETNWFHRFQVKNDLRERSSKIEVVLQAVAWFLILWLSSVLIQRANSSLVVPFFCVWLIITLGLEILSYVQKIKSYQQPENYKKLSAAFALQSNIQRQDVIGKYFFIGFALSTGNLEETEKRAKEIISYTQTTNPVYLSYGLKLLGLALLYQKRYDEALKFIEIAIRINPASAPILTSLSEVYFEQGIEPERILEITDLTQKYGTTDWLNRMLTYDAKLINSGVRAWALTKLGQVEEGEALIQNAMKRMPTTYQAGKTYLQYIKGRIEALKGNPAQAAEWYQRASQNDKGLYGQLAETALKEVQSTS